MNGWNLLISGEILEGLISPFTSIAGGWFYLFLTLMLVSAVQLKLENIQATSVLLILLGGLGAFMELPTPTSGSIYFSPRAVFFILMIIGMAIPAYNIFTSYKAK